MIEQKNQRIINRPSKKEIKLLLQKAKTAQEKEKKSAVGSTPDKIDLLLERFDKVEKWQKKFEGIYNRGIVTAPGSPGPEKKASDQEKQGAKTSEELLKEAELQQQRERGKQEPGQQGGQPQGQMTAEQYKALPPEQKVPLLEAQLKVQLGQQQLGNSNSFGKLMQAINAASPVVIEALRHNKENSGSIDSFFQNLKLYAGVENAVMGNAFRFLKLLSPTQQQAGARNLIDQAEKLPDFPQIPPLDQGHIGE